ncbi:MAG TPA: metal-dependent transcriptional regulator [bacterium]|nr:metal-dependent transcriptional regulator [bacterium]
MLTRSIEDYLKVIWKLQHEEAAVTTNAVAAQMGVAPASATNMLKKLAGLRLVEHTPYHGVVLTAAGAKVALEVIRHHRLLELYLAQALGVSLDRVHEEAERLEHVLSEEVEEKIAAQLGEPTHDPHGDPIPTREGALERSRHPLLADLAPGQSGVIVRVSDERADVVRDLARSALLPGTPVRVTGVEGDGTMRIRSGNAVRTVGAHLARAVYVATDRRA